MKQKSNSLPLKYPLFRKGRDKIKRGYQVGVKGCKDIDGMHCRAEMAGHKMERI